MKKDDLKLMKKLNKTEAQKIIKSEFVKISNKDIAQIQTLLFKLAKIEFENYKKRVARDQQQMTFDVKGRVAKQYLDVADDLARALADKPTDGDGAVWAEGIELIQRKLSTILENEGVKAMEVDGQMFDPSFHEAIGQVESDEHESGQIVEVVQQGYFIGDRVLRPAMVRVAV